MLDHTTLSASQRQSTHSFDEDNLRDTEKNPAVVSDLSASAGNLRKFSVSLPKTVQDGMEIASSIELPRISTTRYSWQEKKGMEFLLFTVQLQILEQRFTLRKRDEIVQLLEKYMLLGSLLLEIHKQIVPYFPNAQFFLQAIADQEADDNEEATDNSENIVLSIVTHSRPREALERLKRFYKDWWLKTPARTKFKERISFNLECV